MGASGGLFGLLLVAALFLTGSIGFVPEPVCWTEAPESLGVLGRQLRAKRLAAQPGDEALEKSVDLDAPIEPLMNNVTEIVAMEIQKTFDFFKATASSDRITRIVVSGGASRAGGRAPDRSPFHGARSRIRPARSSSSFPATAR